MQVATLLATYRPGMDGTYSVSWDHNIDAFVHGTLASLVGLTSATAFCIHILSATLNIDRASIQDLYNPDNEIKLNMSFRVNNLPATYKVNVVLYAGDLVTLEPPDAQISPLPC